MVEPVEAMRPVSSEVRSPKGWIAEGVEDKYTKLMNSRWREKLLWSKKAPVPQTDTGRRGENPKTSGRTLVKELGKMTP